MPPHLWLKPDWSASANVLALSTTRSGGYSAPPYASWNMGEHVGDDAAAVAQNRAALQAVLPPASHIQWLNQVHGAQVVEAVPAAPVITADASWAREPGVFCAVMTADCLPVLFSNKAGTVVAAAHAGWRSLCDGVLENTVSAMGETPENIQAWFGPAIGPDAFEVGGEVREAFVQKSADKKAISACFKHHNNHKYFANLYKLAQLRLHSVGVSTCYGGGFCTYTDDRRFFSYRRDGQTGRMVSLVGLRH